MPELLILPGDAFLLLLVLLPEVLPFLLNELNLLVDLLVILIVLHVETVVHLLDLPLLLLLQLSHPAFVFVDLAPHLEHRFVFLTVLFEELRVAVLHFLDFLFVLFELVLDFVGVFE